ncbi:MAG TPA: 2-C-methyl-D-erythritol 4-phosphate cytidylyltransferase [Solirubrobacterales bacterium]
MTGSGRATALIAAAGSGQRLGAGAPKALVPLAGRPMVEWSLRALAAAEQVDSIVVGAPPEAVVELERLCGPGVRVVEGGAGRSETVAAMLEHTAADLVLVHDAARPLVTPGLVDAMVSELARRRELAGLVAAAPLTDTIKLARRDGIVERTLDRSTLWAAQTPQAFRALLLREALKYGNLAAATDDAMLVEQRGGKVALHEAPPENLKVTTPLDLRVAELLLAERE